MVLLCSEQDCRLPGALFEKVFMFYLHWFSGIFMALETLLGNAVEFHNLSQVLLDTNCSSCYL